MAQQRIPLETVEAALLLASVRRLLRDPSFPPLPLISSLNYFLQVIREISADPLPQDYRKLSATVNDFLEQSCAVAERLQQLTCRY